MLNNHASCHYVVTSVTAYRSALVDLTYSRSVHAVEHDPCCPDPTKLSAEECKAVHYGLCSPLLKLPAFSIPPSNTSTPSSPVTPKQPSSPNSPLTPKGSAPSIAELLGAAVPLSTKSAPPTTVGSPSVQRTPSPILSKIVNNTPVLPVSSVQPKMSAPGAVVANPPGGMSKTSPTPMDFDEIMDPVTLLASNLEDQLEALVNTFVAQDKVRLAARKKAENSNASKQQSLPSIQPTSGLNKYNRKVMDSKSLDENTVSILGDASKSSDLVKQSVVKSVVPHTNGKSPIKNEITDHVDPQQERFMELINGKQPKAVAAQFYEDNVFDRSSSPSFKSSILPSLKPSLEYQQTGVKAQINKFASKEKDQLQNSPTNSLERKQSPRPKTTTQEPQYSPPVQRGPLTLAALQELLMSSTDALSQPIPTTIFQSSRIPSVPYERPYNLSSALDSAHFQSSPSKAPEVLSTYMPPENTQPNSLSYINNNVGKTDSSQSKIQPQVLSSKSDQDFVQSPVDYAKTRFQNVQQVKLEEDANKPRSIKNGHLVSDAKTKWENLGPHQVWTDPHGHSMVISADLDNSLPEPLREALQRSGHRRALSIEGLLDVPSPSIPHPKLTNAQKQHIKERSLSPTDRHSHVPIRPFLTKGSVAERVLLFECCPDRALERASAGNKGKPTLISTWRPGSTDVQNKTQFWEVVSDLDKHIPSAASSRDKENIAPRTNSLVRRVSAKSSVSGRQEIPRFHYPVGKPPSPAEVETHLKKVAAVFAGLNDGKASREEFGIITKACSLPLYWKLPLFLAARGDKKSSVSCETFLEFWRRVVNTCHDESSKFVRVLSKGAKKHLVHEDFIPLMQDVIDSHPGLTFLKEATEFHSRYIQTVISRIFYCVNRSWSGKITIPELRKSNFLQVLSTLEEEDDINQITEYFSYEHFYVIYCKFWELDKDHDLFIDANDLKFHNGGALSTKIIQRIFSGAVTRGTVQKEGKMSYSEFVWFLISEEDKRHPRSIEYWFRCMDLDGDGFLSMYELEYFYREQLQRLDALGIETLPFDDCLCQMLDIIKPKVSGKISLADLKKCKMTPIFFDTFFNLEKYLDHEQRDPFASQREHDADGVEMSDWDRYAAEEYELLVAEEGAAEQQDELFIEELDDELSPNLDKITATTVISRSRQADTEDEEYDYADSDDYHY